MKRNTKKPIENECKNIPGYECIPCHNNGKCFFERPKRSNGNIFLSRRRNDSLYDPTNSAPASPPKSTVGQVFSKREKEKMAEIKKSKF